LISTGACDAENRSETTSLGAFHSVFRHLERFGSPFFPLGHPTPEEVRPGRWSSPGGWPSADLDGAGAAAGQPPIRASSVVAGMSVSGLATLAFGARRSSLAGIVAVAANGSPEWLDTSNAPASLT